MTSPPLAPPQAPSREPSPPPQWGWRLAKVVAVVVIIIVVTVMGADLARDLAIRMSPETSSGEVASGEEVVVVIPAGASARSIATILENEGVIADGDAFELAARRSGQASDLKAGSYTLVAGSDDDTIIATLVAGPAPVEVFRVTVVEGLRIEDMLDALAEQTSFTAEELEEVLLDGSVFSAYLPESDLPAGVPELARWEGLLFPDTYEFSADATPAEILQRMARTLEARVNGVAWEEFEETGMSPYEGLVIASLIEREAKLDEDRTLISSVIHNRLVAEMPLQVDATVIYAVGENRGRVLESDLEIDSPYNTYRVTGLPPTPIAGVRLASLEAAAHPEDTEFLYYVLVDESGEHGFSVTLEEHNQKVAAARDAGILP